MKKMSVTVGTHIEYHSLPNSDQFFVLRNFTPFRAIFDALVQPCENIHSF